MRTRVVTAGTHRRPVHRIFSYCKTAHFNLEKFHHIGNHVPARHGALESSYLEARCLSGVRLARGRFPRHRALRIERILSASRSLGWTRQAHRVQRWPPVRPPLLRSAYGCLPLTYTGTNRGLGKFSASRDAENIPPRFPIPQNLSLCNFVAQRPAIVKLLIKSDT